MKIMLSGLKMNDMRSTMQKTSKYTLDKQAKTKVFNISSSSSCDEGSEEHNKPGHVHESKHQHDHDSDDGHYHGEKKKKNKKEEAPQYKDIFEKQKAEQGANLVMEDPWNRVTLSVEQYEKAA